MADIIPPSKAVQDIIEILSIINNKIDPETDVVWTQYETTQELEKDITDNIEGLRSGDYETLEKINILFLPTGSFQELAISNGWGNEFIKLSNRFDRCYKKIQSK